MLALSSIMWVTTAVTGGGKTVFLLLGSVCPGSAIVDPPLLANFCILLCCLNALSYLNRLLI